MGGKKNIGYIRECVQRLLTDSPKMFPNAKNVSRALKSRYGVLISINHIESVYGDELNEDKARWARKATQEEFLAEIQKKTFHGFRGKLKSVFDERYHRILSDNLGGVDELGLSGRTLEKAFGSFPDLKRACEDTLGINYREFVRRANSRYHAARYQEMKFRKEFELLETMLDAI